MRPWVMQACRSAACCHLGSTYTLRMLERFYWRLGMNVCTRWWLRHCLNCQARKISRLTTRWPIISIPLPEGPALPSASITSALFPSRLNATRTSCSSPIVSAAEPICSQSIQPSSQLRARPTFSSIGIFPSGGARAAYYRTTVTSST